MTDEGDIGLPEAVSIGIGGMVGGGIFAVLGVAVQAAGQAAWIAFTVAGLVALVTAYAFWKLGLAFPSRGGAAEYINQAFGHGIVPGGLNWLLWIGYILMVSIYAFAFGAYGAPLLGGGALLQHLLTSAVVAGFAGINAIGAGEAGIVEDVLVAVKLAILLLFVGAGLSVVDPGVATGVDHGIGGIVFSAGLVFLAYEGFELIANTVDDMEDPETTLPRALLVAVAAVIGLYAAIAFVATASLPVPAIVDAKEHALARAAEPALGSAGFVLVGVAALLSTAGAINGSLYGTQRLTFVMACDRELPEEFEATFRGRHLVGLAVTAVAALVLANVVPLTGMARLASSVFLLVFAAVNLAALALRDEIGASAGPPVLGLVACLGAFAAIVWRAARADPVEVGVLAALIIAAFGMEAVYRRWFEEHTHRAETHER